MAPGKKWLGLLLSPNCLYGLLNVCIPKFHKLQTVLVMSTRCGPPKISWLSVEACRLYDSLSGTLSRLNLHWTESSLKLLIGYEKHESEIWTFEMSGKSPPIIEDMIQDNTLRIWDMRPYAPANRCTKILSGHKHSFEKNLLKCDWSPDGKQVCFQCYLSKFTAHTSCLRLFWNEKWLISEPCRYHYEI